MAKYLRGAIAPHLMLARLLLRLAVALLVPQPARAYGPVGHQIVGAIADERLAGTPAATKVRELLQGYTLQKASVIPDEI